MSASVSSALSLIGLLSLNGALPSIVTELVNTLDDAEWGGPSSLPEVGKRSLVLDWAGYARISKVPKSMGLWPIILGYFGYFGGPGTFLQLPNPLSVGPLRLPSKVSLPGFEKLQHTPNLYPFISNRRVEGEFLHISSFWFWGSSFGYCE